MCFIALYFYFFAVGDSIVIAGENEILGVLGLGPVLSFKTALILPGITQLLQICQLHIHYVNLLFHPIAKVLYRIEIWWFWTPFEYSELSYVQNTVLSFVTWQVILLEVAITK